MRAGLVVSLSGHAVLVVAGLVSLPAAVVTGDVRLQELPVEFIQIAEVTELAIGLDVTAPAPEPPPELDPEPVADDPEFPTPVEVAAVAPEEPAAAEPLPEPAPEPEPTPSPEPVPAAIAPTPMPRPRQLQDADPEPVPGAGPEPDPPVIAEASPAEPAEDDRIAALLNEPGIGDGAAEAGPIELGVDAGAVTTELTVSEIDALASAIGDCWYPPNGWVDPAEIRVVVQFRLNRDGTVIGVPSVVQAPAGRFAVVATERALFAVRQCAPYQLPPDKYEAWQEVRITFDPLEMFLP